jgi:hypothetical protein
MSLSRFNVVEKIERTLKVTAVLAFACFAVVNSSVAAEPYRFYWSFSDRLEEESIPVDRTGTADTTTEGTLRIELEGTAHRSRPVVKINGRVAAGFDGQEAVVRVRDGDLVAIDGLAGDRALTFRIAAASPDIAWPLSGYRMQTRTSQVLLGRVRIDQASR